jgi:hypothetical protein
LRIPARVISEKDILEMQKESSFEEEDLSIWENTVVKVIKSGDREEGLERARKLLEKKTIPPQFRGYIWPKLVGNKQRITRKLFMHLCTEKEKHGVPIQIKRVITNDLVRTWPKLKIIKEDLLLYKELFYMMELFQVAFFLKNAKNANFFLIF